MRAFKTVNDSYVEPISFIVPRRSEVFQDDIYPPVVGLKPAMSAQEWFDGKTELPPKIDLASIFNGEEPTEVAANHNSPTQHVQTPAPKAQSSESTKATKPSQDPVESEQGTQPSTLKGLPPFMKEQTASIKDLASKFNDEEEVEEDDSSSFEEIPKPADRAIHTSTAEPVANKIEKPDGLEKVSEVAASQSTEKQIHRQQEKLSSMKTEPVREQLPSSSVSSAPVQGKSHGESENSELKESLAEIKSLLDEQKKTMNETIGRLTAEVERLRSKIGES